MEGVSLEQDDLQAIFAERNCTKLCDGWAALHCMQSMPTISEADSVCPEEAELPNAEAIREEIRRICRLHRQFRPCVRELVWESWARYF